MARNEQLIRQQKLLQILEGSRFGKTEEQLRALLLQELGLSALSLRTLKRDLEALQFAGYDLDSERSSDGPLWKAGPNLRSMPRIPVSVTELTALSVGRDLLIPLAGTPYWQGLESLWRKLEKQVPDTVWKHFRKHRQKLVIRGVTAKSYHKFEGILATLDRAIRQHRIVKMTYQGLGKSAPTERAVEPYRLIVFQGSIYLLAGIPGVPDAIRQFKLDRFRQAAALDQRFRPRRDIDCHLHDGSGAFADGPRSAFRLHFDAYLAPWVVETPFHPQQEVEPQPDGSLLVVIQAALETEMIPKLLAAGTHVTVIEPLSCRQTLGGIGRHLAALYSA